MGRGDRPSPRRQRRYGGHFVKRPGLSGCGRVADLEQQSASPRRTWEQEIQNRISSPFPLRVSGGGGSRGGAGFLWEREEVWERRRGNPPLGRITRPPIYSVLHWGIRAYAGENFIGLSPCVGLIQCLLGHDQQGKCLFRSFCVNGCFPFIFYDHEDSEK